MFAASTSLIRKSLQLQSYISPNSSPVYYLHRQWRCYSDMGMHAFWASQFPNPYWYGHPPPICWHCQNYFLLVIPISPQSDQHQLSPNNIKTKSSREVTRITARRPKVWPPLINSHSFMQTLTTQKSRTVFSCLLIGSIQDERMWINQKRSHF